MNQYLMLVAIDKSRKPEDVATILATFNNHTVNDKVMTVLASANIIPPSVATLANLILTKGK